ASQGEQFLFIVNHLIAAGAGERIILHQENGFFRTNLLAIPAENATQHVNLEFFWRLFDIACFRCSCRSWRYYPNGSRRTNKLAQLAGNAFDPFILIRNEVRRATISLRHYPFLLRILHRHFLFEEVAERDFKPAEDRWQV